ncbi:MAG: DNA cytosine methyltransferase [Clostridia bacterium]
MKVLELFAGTRSIGKAFESKGHEVYSIEWDKNFKNINWYVDIGTITTQDILDKFGAPDVIWSSFDCTSYSIAGISHHRKKEKDGNLTPISDYAKFCDKVNTHVIDLINELLKLNPNMLYFIENPRGGLRKMNFIKELPRYTITYCQYMLDVPVEERRMKPTDIWTNHPNPKFKPMCKNGDPCHARAPRGSRTGTQGLKGAKERSVIPKQLCEHIVDICEEYIK